MAREPWRAELLMREHIAGIKASLVRPLEERGKDGHKVAGMDGANTADE